jgi:hypothetical protein
VWRTVDLEHGVADLPAESCELLLELRLEVDMRRRGVLDPPAESLDDRLLDRLEPVLQEERCQSCLEERRQDVAVPREPAELLLGNDRLALLDETAPEAELPGDDGATRPGDDVRANLRQPALGEFRVPLVERSRNRQLEDAVTEKLQPLVRRCAVGRPRRVRERVVGSLRRQLVDQPQKAARVALRRLTTGAR